MKPKEGQRSVSCKTKQKINSFALKVWFAWRQLKSENNKKSLREWILKLLNGILCMLQLFSMILQIHARAVSALIEWFRKCILSTCTMCWEVYQWHMRNGMLSKKSFWEIFRFLLFKDFQFSSLKKLSVLMFEASKRSSNQPDQVCLWLILKLFYQFPSTKQEQAAKS